MKIAVVGTGFVGLVQGAAMADVNHTVICVDKLEDKIGMLNEFCERKGEELPIEEPGLRELIRENYDKKRIRFTTSIDEAVKESQVIFIAVGTPSKDDGSANLAYVREVAEGIGKAMNYSSESPIYKIIVNKSTVPVGTSKMVSDIVKQQTRNEFDVISNPEFLAEGRAVKDCIRPSRIVIGYSNPRAAALMEQLYEPFKAREVPVIFMSNVDAELVKYASNTYLAAQVACTNMLANLARKSGGDWAKINQAVKKDVRIGKFVYGGLGFGGSCFPKDVREVVHSLKQYGVSETDLKFAQNILDQNEQQKRIFIPRMEEYFQALQGKKIALWGLTFKPETNDTRESAGLQMLSDLLIRGACVSAYDPSGFKHAQHELSVYPETKPHLDRLVFASDMYEPLKGADAVVITVEWNDFRNPDFEQMKKLMKRPAVFDGKDILNPKTMEELGFDYFSVGRPDVLGYTSTEVCA